MAVAIVSSVLKSLLWIDSVKHTHLSRSEGREWELRSLRVDLEWLRAMVGYVQVTPQHLDLVIDAEDVIEEYLLRRQQKALWILRLFTKERETGDLHRRIETIRQKLSQLLLRMHEDLQREDGIEIEDEDRRRERGKAPISSVLERPPFDLQREDGIEIEDEDRRRERGKAPISSVLERPPFDLVGFEDEAEFLLYQLIEGGDLLSVISIVGVRGLGKTTLAKKIYNSTAANRHFDCFAWYQAAGQRSPREIWWGILESLMLIGKEEEKMDEVELGGRLFEHLKSRRFLVVIDDISIIDDWDQLMSVFPPAMNGSRVMLTSADGTIYRRDLYIHFHNLTRLKYSESWELFCWKIFPESGSAGCPPILKELGEKMVLRCEGLPLAILALGGLLLGKEKSPGEWEKWEKVLNSDDDRVLNGGKDPVSRILLLCYDDLPHYLKSCFLYLCCFPANSEIRAQKLIRLWIAEGFIQERGNRTMEDVASDYLEELIKRSMIQVEKGKSDGRAKTCYVNSLFRNLSISEAKENNFLSLHPNLESTSPVHRLSIHSETLTPHLRSSPHLRSLFFFKLTIERRPWESLCRSLKLLRVLNLEGVNLHSLPNELGKLIHLIYLGLRGTQLKRLPASIGNLLNLQILDLRDTCVGQLPSSIRNLSNLQTLDLRNTLIERIGKWIQGIQRLRHLYMDMGTCISGHSPNVATLRDLCSLSMIRSDGWMEDGLGKLTTLTKLGIYGDLSFCSTEIPKLNNLQVLRLGFGFGDTIPGLSSLLHLPNLCKLYIDRRLEKLPDPREFPPNLRKLCLRWSQLEQDPFATLGRLPNLRILRLHRGCFLGREMVCTKGSFPRLQVLELDMLDSLEVWRVDLGAMPVLRRLVIRLCGQLEMLPVGLQHVTTLQELVLQLMSDEFNAKLRKGGEFLHAIRHVTSVIIRDQ